MLLAQSKEVPQINFLKVEKYTKLMSPFEITYRKNFPSMLILLPE